MPKPFSRGVKIVDKNEEITDGSEPAVFTADGDSDDLFEHAPCAYLSAAADGTIVRVNQTFLRWTGYTAQELVGGRRFQDLLSAGGRVFFDTHYSPLLLMQGWVREIALDVVRADGSVMPAVLHSVLKRDEDGSPQFIRTALFDASERRAYERELLHQRQRAEASEARARELAETLQNSLVPPALPAVPGLDVGAVYRPALSGKEVGGDFFDLFELPGNEWALLVGDVCGKGARAATVTALVRYTARAVAIQQPNPRDVLSHVNHALLTSGMDRFCTAVYARIAVQPNGEVQLRLAAAGHPLPLLRQSEVPVQTAGVPGDLLGVFEDPTFHEVALTLSPGGSLVFYTDGITEGRRGDLFYGEERLRTCLDASQGLSAEEIANAVVWDVLSFQDGLPRDDIAVVAIQAPSRAPGQGS